MTAEAQIHMIEPASMARRMEETRARSLELFALVPDEADLRRAPAPGFRPILWHLGHLGAYEAYWVLQKSKGAPSPSAELESIFDPIKTPREDSSNLPAREVIDAYLERIRADVLDYLHTPAGAEDWYTFHLVLEHELQHQETITFLLHLLDSSVKRPSHVPSGSQAIGPAAAPARNGLVEVPGGPFEMGSYGYPFAYDNEQPPHRVDLATFRIDRFPVTNAEYAGFVDSGGYSIPEVWSEQGWSWREREKVEHPFSWVPGRPWRVRGLFGDRFLDPSEPVWGVSWHEADAYARWAGRRLPTEAEWEKAARGTEGRRFAWGDEEPRPEHGNFGSRVGRVTPVGAFPEGASPSGCMDMAGNVWEWTATEFNAYPGFRAFPYPEYSELWFDGDHCVAKGGSWATAAPILRASFRNFYRRGFRVHFIGFRCVD
jgi:iron(II)-dependent oxidoreductase